MSIQRGDVWARPLEGAGHPLPSCLLPRTSSFSGVLASPGLSLLWTLGLRCFYKASGDFVGLVLTSLLPYPNPVSTMPCSLGLSLRPSASLSLLPRTLSLEQGLTPRETRNPSLLNFNEVQSINYFSYMSHTFGARYKKYLPSSKAQKFFSCIFF